MLTEVLLPLDHVRLDRIIMFLQHNCPLFLELSLLLGPDHLEKPWVDAPQRRSPACWPHCPSPERIGLLLQVAPAMQYLQRGSRKGASLHVLSTET